MSASPSLSILRISSDLYPEVVGGLGIHVHELSKGQGNLGHDVTVLTSDHGVREVPRTERREGYTVIYHQEVARPLNNSIVPGLTRTLLERQGEYDIVHAHSHLFFTTNLAALLTLCGDTPLVVTNHGLVSQTAPLALQKVFLPTLGRYTLNAADLVLCYTETDGRRLRELGVTSPISIVQNGVDATLFRPREHIEAKQQLLYVGRLTEHKGVRELLAAFARLRRRFDGLRLKFVGDGPLRDDLEDLAVERGVRHAVTFAGTVANGDLPQPYNESLLTVLPSRNEGLPRAILESLACETPVVATDLQQMRGVTREGGLTIPDNDSASIRRACSTLLQDDALQDHLGRRGRELVVDEYSWQETVRQTTESYYRLLGVEDRAVAMA